ncbi:MAG: Hpt domain-containing protein [Gemmatimonadetes bacterium]|nr:Hpt domain-containing protein [Gemmatimonadota bacterium]
MTEIPESVRTALDGLRALGGDGLVRQMAGVFIEHSAGRVAALREALESGDAQGAAEAAHTLKGSSRQLGLTVLADACLAVELATKQGDIAGAQAHVAAVHDSYTAATEVLREATA